MALEGVPHSSYNGDRLRLGTTDEYKDTPFWLWLGSLSILLIPTVVSAEDSATATVTKPLKNGNHGEFIPTSADSRWPLSS